MELETTKEEGDEFRLVKDMLGGGDGVWWGFFVDSCGSYKLNSGAAELIRGNEVFCGIVGDIGYLAGVDVNLGNYFFEACG